MTKVLLYSGGMDSVALAELWEPGVKVYVDMGTTYGARERARLPGDVTVVDLPLATWERTDKIIPLRNLFLVAVAAQYGQEIALAATDGDRVLDKSEEFAERAGGLLSYLWSPQHWTAGEAKQVVLPLRHLTKREIVEAVARRARAGGLARVAASWSCYGNGATECGACKPCFRKWVAFAANDLGEMVTDASGYARTEVLPLIAAGRYHRRRETADVLRALGVAAPENEMQWAQHLLAGGTPCT